MTAPAAPAEPAPYGSWASPIDARAAAAHDGHPDHPGLVGDEVWWTEPRPAEGGRRALVRRRSPGTPAEPVLPAPWNVRNRVQEYGGRPWTAAPGPDGPLLVFTHHGDQRLYAHRPDGGGEPVPLTPLSPVGGGLRWADPVLPPGGAEVWCVLEEFTGEGPTEVRRVIAAVPLDGSAADDRAAVRELTGDAHRFTTGPRLSPDGGRAAWIVWDHPRMPWDGTELLVAEVAPGPGGGAVLSGTRRVLGGPQEAVAQADWAGDGTLLAASDREGWWQLYAVDPVSGAARGLCPREEEFAGPLWRPGAAWFAPLDDGRIATLHGVGAQRLGVLDPTDGSLTDVPGRWTEWEQPIAASGDRVVVVAASAVTAHEVLLVHTGASPEGAGPDVIRSDAFDALHADADAATREATGPAAPSAAAPGAGATRPPAPATPAGRHLRAEVAGVAHRDAVPPGWLPLPTARTFPGPDGRKIHAQVYPPRSPTHTGPPGERPPYVIWAHGGPTGRAAMVHSLEIAYFTSRGIGVAEVNYGGSTGYGRAYRERLRERWGVLDVEDCAAVARGLAAEGSADPARLAIRGGSAGGWTALLSLTGTDLYACATALYPVLDPRTWAEGGTHDFESRYLDSLIGPLDTHPERYRERSPVLGADAITVPFLLLQGLEDPICPPGQCAALLTRAAAHGVPHAYLAFEGESHGFRRAETVAAALEAELSLYGQVFGFTPPEVPVLALST
jgi:dienelactone hydrolase